MNQSNRTSVLDASGFADPGVAALAQLAFGSTSAGVTVATGDGPGALPNRLSIRPADALDLDLSDPEQSRFGDYTLLGKLGQGGMGVVYLAHQRSLDREVALKLLAAGPWASPGFIERFRQEAQSAARMQHPNIVTIHEIGEHDGLPFFSMPLVRGESLAECIQRGGALTPRRAAEMMRLVAEAVDYAHRLGVLHLDIKPGNVLLDESGEPKVADFGLARRLEETLASDSGEVSGTPSYMAPEQAIADGRLGMVTDVYALGATLYEALTARPPFRGATARETLEQVVRLHAPVPRSFDRRIPLDLQAICMCCLQKDPAQRYPSARALAEDLGRYLEGREVSARPLNRLQRGLRLVRREPRLSALGALLLLSLIGGLFATTLQWNRAESSADEARSHLWGARSQAAEVALADGNGFRGLRSMVANLIEMESGGRLDDAMVERQRIGVLLANSPRLIDLVRFEQGIAISSVAIAPDGTRFAVAIHHSDGRRAVRQYATQGSDLLWETSTSGLTHATPFADLPHGQLRYTDDGRRILVGLLAMPVLAAPMHSDTIAFDAQSGQVLMPPEPGPGYSDLIFNEDASLALVRWRSDASMRFPDRMQVHTVDGWRALGPPRKHHGVQWMFAPGGHGLVGTDDFARFDLLDPASFELRWTLQLSTDAPARAWRFNHSGSLLALGTLDGSVMLVDTLDGSQRAMPSSPPATIRWLEFSSDDRSLAALAEDGTIMAWDVATGRPRAAAIRERVSNRLGRVRVVGDLLLRPIDNELRAWQLPPPAPFDNFAVPMSVRLTGSRHLFVHAFDLHAESGLLVTGGSDGLLSLWRMPVGGLLPGEAAPLPAATLSFDGRRVVAVDGARVQVIDAGTGRAMGPAAEHPESVRFAEFSADGRWLVTIAGRTLRVLEGDSMALRGEPMLLPQTPLRVEIARQAPVLVAATGGYQGDDYQEQLWTLDLDQARLRPQAPLVAGPLFHIELDPLGQFALTLPLRHNDREPALRLVDLTGATPTCNGIERPEAGGTIMSTAISDDGRSIWARLALPQRRSRILLWDPHTCKDLLQWDLRSSGMEPRLIASRSGVVAQNLVSDSISRLEPNSERHDVRGLGNGESMYDFALSHDGHRAAQATRNAVQIFDLHRSKRLSSLLPLPLAGNDAIAKMAFAPDGRRLLGRSVRGRWLVWELPLDYSDASQLQQLAKVLDPAGAEAPPDDVELAALRLRLRAADPGPPAATLAPAAQHVVTLAAAPDSGVDPRFVPLDLSRAVNLPLRGPGPRNPGTPGDLTTVSAGIHRFNGIDFLVEGGVQLSGGGPSISIHPFNPHSGNIPVPADVRPMRVHALVMQLVPVSPRAPPRRFADVVLIGVDGRETALEIQLMRDVVTNWMIDIVAPSARIGWVGIFPAQQRDGGYTSSHTPSIVNLASLDVPTEVGEVAAVRLKAGSGSMEAPMFYAVTLEVEPDIPSVPDGISHAQ